MIITIIGCGYVGLTTSIALAYIGHNIHCIDRNQHLIESLQKGDVTIHEKHAAELLENVRENITFGQWDSFYAQADIVIIAVGTPCKGNGDADLTYVESVAHELGRRLSDERIPVIVIKSTVPIGSARRVELIVKNCLSDRGIDTQVLVVSNPEFLREGEALFDTFLS